MKSIITLTESKQLVSLEKKIEAGRKTFVEVGLALAEIRDGKLYRADHNTFEDYCREKWGWKRQRAYELIDAAKITSSLPASCNQKITNEAQAAELSKAKPDQREEVLRSVAAKGPVTAKAIREEIQEAVEVEKPRITIDDQWKTAPGKKEIPVSEPDQPKLTPLQNMMVDLDCVLDQAVETLSAPDLAKFKLHVEVSLRKLRPL